MDHGEWRMESSPVLYLVNFDAITNGQCCCSHLAVLKAKTVSSRGDLFHSYLTCEEFVVVHNYKE